MTGQQHLHKAPVRDETLSTTSLERIATDTAVAVNWEVEGQ